MWVKEVFLAVIALSAGFIVAGGLFAFLSSLGIVSDMADRTHTGDKILLYEDAMILGGSLGNLFFIYQVNFYGGILFQAIFGLFAGIFVGCWAISLAETLNVFPIFIRRIKLFQGIPYIILSIAIGKGIGSCIYFFFGW